MSGKSVNFDNNKKENKSDFYKNKKVTKIDDIDVNKILVSKEEPYGTKNSFKYFIGYNDNDVIRQLCVNLPQMAGYVKKRDDNVTMSFKISNKQLFKKYNQIWEKVEKLLKIEFDSKPVYGDDDKYIKTKVKAYAGSMTTNFQGKKMPKEKAPSKCLSIIMLDSLIKAKKKYYPQTLLEECKYEQERIKIENLPDDDLEKSESDKSDSETESDIDNDESEENFVKRI